MIRVVLAVALAVVLLAAVLPAVDSARADRTATELEVDVERLVWAAQELVTDEDATGPGLPGARRVVEVEIPARSWTATGVEYVSIGGVPEGREDDPDAAPGGASRTGTTASRATTDDDGVITYRIEGQEPTVVRSDVRLRGRHGPVVLREPGRHRLVLSLVRDDGLVVIVGRA